MVGTRSPVHRAAAAAARQLAALGDELRDARVAAGTSQEHVATESGMSRQRYSRIERGRCPDLSLVDLHRLGSVVGLSASVRLYPVGLPLRDAAQASRLKAFLALAAAPLKYRLEVSLPARVGGFEQRAWDAVLYGRGRRTGIELETRLRDLQGVIRRIDLKRRDDPTESFLLLVADTRVNRRVLAEYARLLVDLPRRRPSDVRAELQGGRHPQSGIVLV